MKHGVFRFLRERLQQTKRDKQAIANLASYHGHVCGDRKYEKFHESESAARGRYEASGAQHITYLQGGPASGRGRTYPTLSLLVIKYNYVQDA